MDNNEMKAIDRIKAHQECLMAGIDNRGQLAIKALEIYNNEMEVGKDYGKPKDSKIKHLMLYKAGAERLIFRLNLIPAIEQIAEVIELKGFDSAIFSVDTDLKLIDVNGVLLAHVTSNCNSAEAKYRSDSKWVTEKNLPEGVDKVTLPSRDNKSSYGEGTYKTYKISSVSNPLEHKDTIKAMSLKRALVRGALMATGLSYLFSSEEEISQAGSNGADAQGETEKASNESDLKSRRDIANKLVARCVELRAIAAGDSQGWLDKIAKENIIQVNARIKSLTAMAEQHKAKAA